MGDITNILILGKTGNGKSATGNSILRRTKFNTSADSTSVTSDVTSEHSKHNDRTLKVFDAPGVGDTHGSGYEVICHFVEKMDHAIRINPAGYHAFLLVVRYGVRFTEEEVNAVNMLKRIFGKNFLKKFCVLVLSFGDIFQADNIDTGFSFSEWRTRQTGCFREIIKECNDRVVLFNNETKDPGEKERQLDELIAVVDQIQNCYTNHHFEKARKSRDKFLIESKIPVLQERIIPEVRQIQRDLRAISNLKLAEQLSWLNKLLPQVVKLVEEIKQEDKGTGALDEIKETIEDLRQTVDTEIKNNKTMTSNVLRVEVDVMRVMTVVALIANFSLYLFRLR